MTLLFFYIIPRDLCTVFNYYGAGHLMLQVSTITFLLHAIFHQYSHFIISIIFCRETGSRFPRHQTSCNAYFFSAFLCFLLNWSQSILNIPNKKTARTRWSSLYFTMHMLLIYHSNDLILYCRLYFDILQFICCINRRIMS